MILTVTGVVGISTSSMSVPDVLVSSISFSEIPMGFSMGLRVAETTSFSLEVEAAVDIGRVVALMVTVVVGVVVVFSCGTMHIFIHHPSTRASFTHFKQ